MSGAFQIPGPKATDLELEMFAQMCRGKVFTARCENVELIPWGSVNFTIKQLLKFADSADIQRGVVPPKRNGEDL